MATQNARPEFWLPHSPTPAASSRTAAVSCPRCGAEFMIAAHYCHACGEARNPRLSQLTTAFQKPLARSQPSGFGLPTLLALGGPSLLAFGLGLGCLLAALAVGLVYPERDFAAFQSIQFWRVEWLLAAILAFLAGILLKIPGSTAE